MKGNWRLQLLMELCCLGQNELAQLAGMDKAVRSRVVRKQKKVDPSNKTNLMQVLERRLSNLRLDSFLLLEVKQDALRLDFVCVGTQGVRTHELGQPSPSTGPRVHW